jgi:glutamate-1-semialdehyde 2,1-aminomutase
VWDLDGNEFIEYGGGMRSVSLGHAYAPVVEAAHRQMLLGNNFTRPSSIEVSCAQMLMSHVPSAEMVKFAKDGSTIMTAAVKLARAHTGRDMIALCVDSPFFSYNDWFIGTTGIPAGIPEAIRSLTTTFRFNDTQSVEAVFARYPGQVACIVLEPARAAEPREDFLHRVRAICDREGAVLIIDETVTGFRWANGGAHREYGVTPDLSCFGKAMANGFSLSALTGRREIMELGGLNTTRERVFLLSTTHGAENPCLAAATETMRVYHAEPVIEHMYRAGERLRAGIERAVAIEGMEKHFCLHGRSCGLLWAVLDAEGAPSQSLRTLFLQETIRRGVIAPNFFVGYSHTNDDVDMTIDAVSAALAVVKAALAEGVDRYLVGSPSRTVYRARN